MNRDRPATVGKRGGLERATGQRRAKVSCFSRGLAVRPERTTPGRQKGTGPLFLEACHPPARYCTPVKGEGTSCEAYHPTTCNCRQETNCSTYFRSRVAAVRWIAGQAISPRDVTANDEMRLDRLNSAS